jgi:hypothetical protein
MGTLLSGYSGGDAGIWSVGRCVRASLQKLMLQLTSEKVRPTVAQQQAGCILHVKVPFLFRTCTYSIAICYGLCEY